MFIDELMHISPPPESPDEVGTREDLCEIEQRFGFTLPEDYRDFCCRYGTGSFIGTFLEVWTPFLVDLPKVSADPDGRPAWFYKRGYLPWAPFPAKPGLLEIGGNENGDTILYLTEGDPNHWPILVVPHEDEGDFERWDMPLVTFLHKALTCEINTAAVGPDPIVLEDRLFMPVGDRWPTRR